MQTFKAGHWATPRYTSTVHPFARGEKLRVEAVTGNLPNHQFLTFEGRKGSYSSSHFERLPDGELVTPKAEPTAFEKLKLSAPDANPKTIFGLTKPPLSLIPNPAQLHVACAFRDGAVKYGPANWRVDPVSASTYLNAAMRHIAAWQDGEEQASDSGVHHLGHAAACLMILLDAQACGTLQDDRPPAAPTGDLIKTLTIPMN